MFFNASTRTRQCSASVAGGTLYTNRDKYHPQIEININDPQSYQITIYHNLWIIFITISEKGIGAYSLIGPGTPQHRRHEVGIRLPAYTFSSN